MINGNCHVKLRGTQDGIASSLGRALNRTYAIETRHEGNGTNFGCSKSKIVLEVGNWFPKTLRIHSP